MADTERNGRIFFLVEKDGDSALCLTPLRLKKSNIFAVRVALYSRSSPEAQAVNGHSGIFKGRDYAGNSVIAYLHAVPNTPWFIAAKLNEREITGAAYYRGGVVVLLILLLIIASVSATAYAFRHRQAVTYRELYRAEVERSAIQGEFRATLYSMGDAVITTDVKGSIRQMNPVAELLTGWSEAEAVSKRLVDVCHILNEDTGDEVESPADRVLHDGVVIGLANHTVLVSRNGARYPIADSGAPIHDDKGNVIGVVLIFRDQTKEREAERALRESELRLKQSERVTRVGHYIFDTRTGEWSSSEMLDELFGIDDKFKRTVDGWLDLVHQDDREAMRSYFANDVLTNKKEFDREYRIRRKYDGKELWVHGLGTLEFDDSGTPLKMFGTIQDITEWKRAEEALHKSEGMLKDVIDTVPVRVFWKDKESNYVGCNLPFAIDSGFNSPDEIKGKNDFQMGWRDQAERYRADDREIIRTGKGKLNFEEPRVFPDGVHWLRASKVPLRDPEGEVIGVLGSYEDITGRRREREELRQSEEKFRGLVEGSSAAIWIHDGSHILYANPAALEMTGYTFEEISRLSVAEIVHPEFRDFVMKRSSERLNGDNVSKHYEFQILTKSGNAIWIDFSGGGIEYEGKPAIIASAYDITERKKLEEHLAQVQKMEGIGRLAGGVAHDYNNMLGVIMGYAELINRKI